MRKRTTSDLPLYLSCHSQPIEKQLGWNPLTSSRPSLASFYRLSQAHIPLPPPRPCSKPTGMLLISRPQPSVRPSETQPSCVVAEGRTGAGCVPQPRRQAARAAARLGSAGLRQPEELPGEPFWLGNGKR